MTSGLSFGHVRSVLFEQILEYVGGAVMASPEQNDESGPKGWLGEKDSNPHSQSQNLMS